MPSRTQSRARGGSRQNSEAAESQSLVPFNAKEKALEISRSIDGRRDQLLSLLGGDERLTDRFITVALDAIVKNRDVLSADPLSILGALRDAAMLGLEPAGSLGDGAIVAYARVAQFQPMYRGLMKLARQSGLVASIDAAIVYQHDEFAISRGTNPEIRHFPSLDPDPGAVKGAYAFAKLSSGELVVRYWPIEKILQHRDRFSKAWKSQGQASTWGVHPEPMILKTVVRDLMKFLPLGYVAKKALAHDDAVEIGTVSVPDRPGLPSRTRRRAGAGDDVENGSQGSQNGSGDTEDEKADSDTGAADDGAQGPSNVEICGRPGLSEGEFCVIAAGHDGPHRSDNSEWL